MLGKLALRNFVSIAMSSTVLTPGMRISEDSQGVAFGSVPSTARAVPEPTVTLPP